MGDSLRDDFQTLIKTVTDFIGDRSLDDSLELDLNQTFSATSLEFKAIESACAVAIKDGWMCKYEAAGIRYGRVIKPSDDLKGYSVDVVDMENTRGPHHRHPRGEIDMVMPTQGDALFDGQSAGWKVYASGSAHFPTVTGGRALVLYLLPAGEIEFT
ncbi:MAG: hypothetical protein ACI9XC_001994 [Gammaproteobacteria bacterium]|jgi:hypothetical protein